MEKQARTYTKKEVEELCKQAYQDAWQDCLFNQNGLTDIAKDWNQGYLDADDWCVKNIK